MGREEKAKAKSEEPNQQVLGSDKVCMGLYPEDAGSREGVDKYLNSQLEKWEFIDIDTFSSNTI